MISYDTFPFLQLGWNLHFCQMSNQRVCADRHLEALSRYIQKHVTFPVKSCQTNLYWVDYSNSNVFFFMARVLLIQGCNWETTKISPHCCSTNARAGREVFFARKHGALPYILAFHFLLFVLLQICNMQLILKLNEHKIRFQSQLPYFLIFLR